VCSSDLYATSSPWESFRPLLEDLTGDATRDWKKGGKPSFDPVLMFKVLVLQKFHGLSDDATEEQIFDHTSFKSFLGLRIGDDIPDAKTLWDFKQCIEADGRDGGRKLFDAFNTHLEGRGIIAREGGIIDASFTEAPRQRNEREQNQRIKQGERPEELTPTPPSAARKTARHAGAKRTTRPTSGGRTM
jgi:IS5 family transposase